MGFARVLTRSCIGSSPECRIQCRAQLHTQPFTVDGIDQQAVALAHAMRDDELHVLQLCEDGQLDRALDVLFGMGTVSSSSTYLALLKRCIKNKAPCQAKQIHAHLVRFNLQVAGLLGDYLVMTLAKCGAIEDAIQISNTLPHRTIFSWTAIISAYADCGLQREALQRHQLMEADGVQPNSYTFVSLFKACSSIEHLGEGKKLHTDAQMRGLTSDVFIGSALMQMYGKCGAVVDAENVFIALSNRDLVTWNNMILIYVEAGEGSKALRLYRQMQDEGVRGNQHTPVFCLQACRILAEKEDLTAEKKLLRRMLLEIGQGIHADTCRTGLASDVFVASTLVKLYGVCEAVSEAEHAFYAVAHGNEVLWNSMLSTYVEHDYGEKALLFYGHMLERGMNFDQQTLVFALRACGILAEKAEADVVDGLLDIVYALHVDACMKEVELDVFFATTLLSIYGKCGGVVEAEDMFAASTQHDVVSWNAMLAAYTEQGNEERALQMYRQLGEQDMVPDGLTYVLALRACGIHGEKERWVGKRSSKMLSLESRHSLHMDVCKRGIESCTLVANSLISMYGKCGQVAEAESVFIGSFQRVVVSWNVMLSAYVEFGHGEKVLRLYRQMQEEGMTPDQLTFVMALQSCGVLTKSEAAVDVNVACLEIGQALHGDARKKGYTSDALVANTLVSMYGKLGAVSEAEDAFLGAVGRDVVSWNAILSAYAEHDRGDRALHLYRQMHLEGVHPDALTLIAAFQACCSYVEIEADSLKNRQLAGSISLAIGQALHTDVLMKGFESNVFISSAMMSMYGKCRATNEAEAVFGALSNRDQVSWSAMLMAYSQQGQGEKALQLYRQMHEEGVTINQHTVVFLLQACGILAEKIEALVVDGQAINSSLFEIGQAFHSYASKHGWTMDVHVGNTLVSMYGKCGAIKEAESTFDALPQINVVSLNAMLSAYLEQGQDSKALQLYRWVLMGGITPDQLTYAMTLQACGMIAEKGETCLETRPKPMMSYEIGQALHADASRMGFVSDAYVASTLVSMYGKCGAVAEAEAVFDALSQQNIVSCNAMLSAHVQHGQEEKALQLYRQMQKQCEIMDEITFTCLLQACSVTGSLDMCEHLHFSIVSAGYDSILFVAATLVCAYGSCASMVNVHSFFNGLSKPDIGVWNACIDGHAREGNASASEYMFESLTFVGIKPDKVTFTSMISACSHTGLSAKGLEYFESMSREYGIDRDLKHYGSMLDLLGRAGQLERVQDMLRRMPILPDLNIWLALLGACHTHQNLEMAAHAFNHAVSLHPEDSAAYVFISNIYAESGA